MGKPVSLRAALRKLNQVQLHDAISSEASSSGLSASLLLSVIMQESSGIIAVGVRDQSPHNFTIPLTLD
jgi:hypothetical protein